MTIAFFVSSAAATFFQKLCPNRFQTLLSSCPVDSNSFHILVSCFSESSVEQLLTQKMFIRSWLILFVCEASWRFSVPVHPFTDWDILSTKVYASLNLTISHLKLSRWKEFLNSVVAWTYAQNVFSNLANVVQLTHACQLFANEKNHFAFVKLSVSII